MTLLTANDLCETGRAGSQGSHHEDRLKLIYLLFERRSSVARRVPSSSFPGGDFLRASSTMRGFPLEPDFNSVQEEFCSLSGSPEIDRWGPER